MNALTLLKQDHQNIESLFKRFEHAEDSQERKEISEKILEHLSIHAAIEEQVFYPAVRAKLVDETPALLEALEEHHVTKLSLTEIEKLPASAERLPAKVRVLIESVRHHISEEEDGLFPKVRDSFTVQELDELGTALEEAKKGAPTRPHPFQPDQPPLNVILGLPVAIIDRMITTGKQALVAAGRLSRR